jgi:hypothetical protein
LAKPIFLLAKFFSFGKTYICSRQMLSLLAKPIFFWLIFSLLGKLIFFLGFFSWQNLFFWQKFSNSWQNLYFSLA